MVVNVAMCADTAKDVVLFCCELGVARGYLKCMSTKGARNLRNRLKDKSDANTLIRGQFMYFTFLILGPLKKYEI